MQPEVKRWVGRFESRRYPVPPYGGTFDLTLLWPAGSGRALSGTVKLRPDDGAEALQTATAVGGLVGDRRALLTARFGERLLTLNLTFCPESEAVAGDYDVNDPADAGGVSARRYIERAGWCSLL